MSTQQEAQSGSIFTQGTDFVRGSIDELKKVTTPTRQETTQATIVTVIIMVFTAFCLFLLDMILGRLMSVILS